MGPGYPGLHEVGELEVRGRVQKVPVWTIDVADGGDAAGAAAATPSTAA